MPSTFQNLPLTHSRESFTKRLKATNPSRKDCVLDSTIMVKAPLSQVLLQAFIYKGNMQKGKDENAAMNHQNPWLFAILSFPSL